MQVLFLFAFFSIAGVKEQDRGREVWLTKIKRRGKAYLQEVIQMTKEELIKLGLTEEQAEAVTKDYGEKLRFQESI